jgi:hypothetical protein
MNVGDHGRIVGRGCSDGLRMMRDGNELAACGVEYGDVTIRWYGWERGGMDTGWIRDGADRCSLKRHYM